MTDIYCYSFVEDEPSADVAKKLVDIRNTQCSNSIYFRDGFPSVMNGYGIIKKKFPAFLRMAHAGIYTFVLTDLDAELCAPELIEKWLPSKPKTVILPKEVIFRIAVREVEAWILADRDAFAEFMGIPVANFSKSPDNLIDPKQYLFSIIQRKGHKKWHREMLPRENSHIGPKYNEKICKFVKEKWKPQRASSRSPSLQRAIRALKTL